MHDRRRTEPLDTELRPREDVLRGWREEGYPEALTVVPGGAVTCTCEAGRHPAGELAVASEFRYEGMSAPGDEELLVAATTPCGRRGTLTLGYGPSASADDAELARALPRDRSA